MGFKVCGPYVIGCINFGKKGILTTKKKKEKIRMDSVTFCDQVCDRLKIGHIYTEYNENNSNNK